MSGTSEGAAQQTVDDLPVFSERLTVILEDMVKGEAPNAGRFCGNCYTPIDPQRTQCTHCSQPVKERPPVPVLILRRERIWPLWSGLAAARSYKRFPKRSKGLLWSS